MKKTVLILLLTASLFAKEDYTKEHRINDMQIMADAMSEIQMGFFYNNKDLVERGSVKLSDAIRRIEPPLEDKEEADPMTRYMNQKVKFTDKIVKKIDNKAKTIMGRFREGDIVQSIQAYNKIMKQCVECHTQVRHW